MARRTIFRFLVLSSLALLSACASRPTRMSDHECMARAMYFESNRSSEEGMLAVGTVVMNRLNSGKYPANVCGVVGQKNQFAPGVLTKPMGTGKDLASQTARKVLRGARHSQVGGNAMFFHTAGYFYPYNNMHYVAVLGGNAFYEKRRNPTQTQAMVTPRREPVPKRPPLSPAMRTLVDSSRAQRGPVPFSAPPLPAMSIEDIIRSGG